LRDWLQVEAGISSFTFATILLAALVVLKEIEAQPGNPRFAQLPPFQFDDGKSFLLHAEATLHPTTVAMGQDYSVAARTDYALTYVATRIAQG
jgi:hypothetical protein